MLSLQDDYNSQRSPLNIAEYGRTVQEYVAHIKTLPTKEERTKWVYQLVNIMATLNPNMKLQSDYQAVLWGHIYQISNYTLDIDSPYPLPTEDIKTEKPAKILYNDTGIRFRFYGRNLQNMIDKVTEIEDENLRQDLVNLIASFMFNSCKIWNDENLTNEVIAEHLSILSKGKLRLSGDEITVTADASSQFTPKKNFSNSSNNRNNFNRKNNKNNFSKNKRQRRF
jgi:hypothetical protein